MWSAFNLNILLSDPKFELLSLFQIFNPLCVCVCVCVVLSHVQLFVIPWTIPHQYPTRLLCPWNFPGKNTGAGCHFLLQGISRLKRSNRISRVSCIGRWIDWYPKRTPPPQSSPKILSTYYVNQQVI